MISLKFFSILILSLIIYWILQRQWQRNVLLIVASYGFIHLMDPKSAMVVASLSVITYAFGLLIEKYHKHSWIHSLSVILVLAVLIIYKYLGFLTRVFNSLAGFMDSMPQFEIEQLLLPLGISYIIFKHVSYLTDIKWKLVKPGRFIDFLLYSSFFTIFVAGPIERFERFKPQVEQRCLPFSLNNLKYGLMRISVGLFKKLVIADWLDYIFAPILANPQLYAEYIRPLALIAYSFQIYLDFAGYSDIAIGASRLFGIKIMENFNNPYLAPNISQFWRRWHISLSDWIKDYIFFPLSQLNHRKLWHIFFVPVIAMAVCGMWHGQDKRFLFWGIWHGLGLFAYQFYKQNIKKSKNHKLNKVFAVVSHDYLSIAITYTYVVLGWVIFYGSKGHLIYQNGMHWSMLAIVPGALFVVWLLSILRRAFTHPHISKIGENPIFAVYILIAVALLCCLWTGDFIYAYF